MSTIGQKQTRVSLQHPTATPDGQGGRAETWSTYATVWASERPLTGREALLAQQLTAVLTSVWELWYRTDLCVRDRLVVGSRTLEVERYQDPDGRRAELRVFCSEVQA